MSRWQSFYHNVQQDLKLFLYTLFLLCLARISFIFILSNYLNEATTFKEILSALYYGLRISLKSAGIGALFSFLFCTIPNTIMPVRNLSKIRFGIGSIYIAFVLLASVASIPYYKEFHVMYSQFIFNTFYDDTGALYNTLVQQYHLWGNLFLFFVFTGIFCWFLKVILHTSTFPIPRYSKWYGNLVVRVAIILVVAGFMLFTRFGGSFTYANSIHWENSAVCRDEFLNEAVLDGVQALYRSYSSHERLKKAAGLHVDSAHIAEYAKSLSNNEIASSNLDDYLKKSAQGSMIPKPKHIFVIIGESYAEWPLLPKYKELNIANGLRSIIAKENAVYVPEFTFNGNGTIGAVTGVISGLAEVQLYPNYQPASYKEPYSTAFALQMRKLGYKTNFWYGGFPSWQRVKDFALSQGFDAFYGCNDFPYLLGNSWGADDKYLFNAINASLSDDQPSFHVILNTSNHPPYSVDLTSEGFDEKTILEGVPDNLKTNKEVINKLGHFWYADKEMADFVKKTYAQYPDSLFIITGDHSKDYLGSNHTGSELNRIPLVIYGQGINKAMIPERAAGSHINIIPTVIELIAPKGFEYYSLGKSLTQGNNLGISNGDTWITAVNAGKITNNQLEVFGSTGAANQDDFEMIKQNINAIKAISWWRIEKGKYITNPE